MATVNRHILAHREVIDHDSDHNEANAATVFQYTMANVVWFVFGVIMVLLGVRFVFELLSANPANSIANFVYTTSHSFVAPFFNLFNFNVVQTGASTVEIYTLVAILVYALIAWALTRLVTINRHY